MAARLDEAYPSLTRLIVRTRVVPTRAYAVLQWEAVRRFGPGEIVVDPARLEPVPEPAHGAGEILLREDVLAHNDETAGGLMTTSLIRLRGERTAGEALGRVRQDAAGLDLIYIYYLFAVDAGGRLRGVVNLKELFQAPVDAPLEGIITKNVISVPPETGKEDVARLFSKYGFRAIPVVDADGILLGAIRFRAIVSAVAPELSS